MGKFSAKPLITTPGMKIAAWPICTRRSAMIGLGSLLPTSVLRMAASTQKGFSHHGRWNQLEAAHH